MGSKSRDAFAGSGVFLRGERPGINDGGDRSRHGVGGGQPMMVIVSLLDAGQK